MEGSSCGVQTMPWKGYVMAVMWNDEIKSAFFIKCFCGKKCVVYEVRKIQQ